MNRSRTDKGPRRGRTSLVRARPSPPWATIAGALIIVIFAGVVFGYVVLRDRAKGDHAEALAPFAPSAANQDPSTRIPGVTVTQYEGGTHVLPTEQVAYTQSPPLGGAHDPYWAACSGVVYERPVRSENLVHSMEHGAAWIAYNPDHVTGDRLAEMVRRVQGEPYTVLSPYPGLDQPISLQTWGHQLKLSDVTDPRIDQFLTALRRNPYTHPEVGASCQALGSGKFDEDQPPPYQPAPPVASAGQPGIRTEVAAPTNSKPGGAGS